MVPQFWETPTLYLPWIPSFERPLGKQVVVSDLEVPEVPDEVAAVWPARVWVSSGESIGKASGT